VETTPLLELAPSCTSDLQADNHMVFSQRDEIIRLLIEEGVDMNQKDSFGHTALFRFADNGQVAPVKMLLARGFHTSYHRQC
jgi:ankyrin repeat protein